MFRLTRSMLALGGTKSSSLFRPITTQTIEQHEVRQKQIDENEETVDEEIRDQFTKEFLGNQIKVTEFQKILLTVGSSIAALLDPKRQDMIACLGETTGEDALQKILQIMQESEEGKVILQEKPRINTKTVNLDELKSLAPDTFGNHYYNFLEHNVSFEQLINFNLEDSRFYSSSKSRLIHDWKSASCKIQNWHT